MISRILSRIAARFITPAEAASVIAKHGAQASAATAFGASASTAAAISNIVYGISYGAVTLGAYAGLSAATRPKMPSSEQAIPVSSTEPYAQWGYGRARIHDGICRCHEHL